MHQHGNTRNFQWLLLTHIRDTYLSEFVARARFGRAGGSGRLWLDWSAHRCDGLSPKPLSESLPRTGAHPNAPLPRPLARADNWSVKAIRRKTTGTGRMQHLKVVHRRFKNGFQEGEAKKQA